MTKEARWYYRIIVFNNFYSSFVALEEKYDKQLMLDYTEKKQLFALLKTCYEFYYKSLRDILNENKIFSFLPSEIFIQAEKEKIINDSKIWLDYIQELNQYYQTYGAQEQEELTIKIIDKFKSKLKNAANNLNKFCNIPTKEEIHFKQFDSSTQPSYTPLDIGITEYSYNLLLQTFKANKDIKYAWLHGSRAKANARKNSDIDLLLDIDAGKIQECKNNFDNLTIPYRVDAFSINDESDESFARKVSKYAKIIYRQEDFN